MVVIPRCMGFIPNFCFIHHSDCYSLFQSKNEPGEEPVRWWRKLLSVLVFGTNLAAGAVGMWEARLCCLRFPRKRIIPRCWGWGIILFRHFHGPLADGRNCSNSLRLACCMRWAASV